MKKSDTFCSLSSFTVAGSTFVSRNENHTMRALYKQNCRKQKKPLTMLQWGPHNQAESINSIIRTVFKWLSKNQNQSNNLPDQSQQEWTERWNQSQFLEITCNSLKMKEKSRVRVIGFGLASHWLKKWHKSF